MPAPKPSKTIAKKKVRIHSEKYLIRTIEPDDASDRWAGWMSDPQVRYMLNTAARDWTKADVASYIKTFDQRRNLLLGIFEKQTGTHIGIFTVDIHYGLGHFLVNLLIGEPAYRNKHVTTSIALPFREYFFETLGLNAAMASVLARNTPMIHYLLKNGWQLEQTVKQDAKSHPDGAVLDDVCLFSLSREVWRDWKKKTLAQAGKG
jgi:RimJ/RimL family protein N-acetyltransferase